jgi:hypothetical protein
MPGERGPGSSTGERRHDRKAEVGGRNTHPRGHAHARTACDRCLDEEQADRADLRSDREPCDQTGYECVRRVDAAMVPADCAKRKI